MASALKHGRVPVNGKNGMVAASQPLAAEIGLDILQQGGSAVDAAIATNAALGLMEPHMCGPGGDLFAIVYDAGKKQLYGLNGSGRSPRGLSYEMLKSDLEKLGDKKIPADSLHSISVPGVVHAWFTLHERFGQLPFSRLLQPTIDYAEQGFSVTPVIAGEWSECTPDNTAGKSGAFAETYLPGGRTPRSGEVFSNPDLAASCRLIAEEGCRAFYQGGIAENIDRFMRDNGGYLRKEDLSTHECEWVAPVSINYRGYDIYELPPNGQGLTVLQMLRMLEDDDLSLVKHPDANTIHLLLEIKKLAFEDRARFYADPDFYDVPVTELLSKAYCEQRRQLVTSRAATEVPAGDPVLRHGDTVYLTTADSNGNMVSLIQSIYYGFGSGFVVPGTGFALQNRGMLFSLDPGHPNVYAPGKRPFHTIIPAFIMRDDKPFMSFGVMGGDMQPQGHLQIITNMIDFGLDIQAAGDAPRWRHEGSSEPTDDYAHYACSGGKVLLEDNVSLSLVEALSERGHEVYIEQNSFGFGGYQAIMCTEDDGYYGASECRKDGCALGY